MNDCFLRKLADKLWENANLDFPFALADELLDNVEHPVECIQSATAEALASLLQNNSELVKPILDSLIKLYKDRLVVSFLHFMFQI